SPGNAMQRAAIGSRSDFFIGPASLTQSKFLRQIHHAEKFGAVPFQTRQVELREIGRFDLARFDQPCQVSHGKKRQFVVGSGRGNVDGLPLQWSSLVWCRLARQNGSEEELRLRIAEIDAAQRIE